MRPTSPTVENQLRFSGYEIYPTIYDYITLAVNRERGDEFLYDVRMKQTPSFHRNSGKYEFGIDMPEYKAYLKPKEKYPDSTVLVFFETLTPHEIKWIDINAVTSRGRKWQDPRHFPNGIIFVNANDPDMKTLTNCKKIIDCR